MARTNIGAIGELEMGLRGVGMAKLYSLERIMDDCLDPRHGSDDGWSALSYMNPILGFLGN